MRITLLTGTILFAACVAPEPAGPEVAHLGDGAAPPAFERIAARFEAANPGYLLRWRTGVRVLRPISSDRILFVQSGDGAAFSTDPRNLTPSSAGDLILVRRGQGLEIKGTMSVLEFVVPVPLPDDLPSEIRPDWDPRITDTPGGCATESGAYRRICLTWLPEVGPYVFRGLNAHRVRIADSFTHYHPIEGGFDEFYLVQHALPGAGVWTGEDVARIETGDVPDATSARSLLRWTPLRSGDLVHLPRGMVHRGLGGVLAHVITVPGFRPGAEIGVDHHLRAISERLGLRGAASLPFNEKASAGPNVK